jgi:hypothetical protein|nr:MAG TPA: hypothetical protein [Caudoviricetes sp.]
MFCLIENIFKNNEFDLILRSKNVGVIKFDGNKYYLNVEFSSTHLNGKSVHKTLKDAFETALELLFP